MTTGELETVTIEDKLMGTTEITGIKIAEVSTQRKSTGRPKPRWGVNRVYKLESGGYVLVREAFSLIYHQRDTRCRTANQVKSGEEATREEMAAELAELRISYEDIPSPISFGLTTAVSCEVCQPAWPEDLTEGQVIRYEFPRRTIDQCEDRAMVVRRLTSSRKYSGVSSAEIPEPTRDLLAQCARNDPTWAESALPVVKIQ